jgi:hypothetical protein
MATPFIETLYKHIAYATEPTFQQVGLTSLLIESYIDICHCRVAQTQFGTICYTAWREKLDCPGRNAILPEDPWVIFV